MLDEFLNPSDEEVLRYASEVSYSSEGFSALSDEESDYGKTESNDREINEFEGDDALSRKNEEDSEEEESWGPSRHVYYDADKIETEQDALDEEKEALRIQRKHLQGLDKADFGFDEADWKQKSAHGVPDEDEEEKLRVSKEILPQKQITEDMTPTERLDILNRRYPEFEPLSQEFVTLQKLHEKISSQISKFKDANTYQYMSSRGSILVKHYALTAYLASLTMYFAILSTPQGASEAGTTIISPANLRIHPIMDSLYRCRTLWEKVKNYPTDDGTNVQHDRSDVGRNQSHRDEIENQKLPIFTQPDDASKQQKKTNRRKNRLQVQLQAEAKEQLAEKTRELEEELEELDSLAILAKQPNRPSVRPKVTMADDGGFSASDLGEETEITPYEAAEKANKRKRLRFYTSQIAQRANRRDIAGKGAGGDTDIPHRERLRDRSARLTADAAKRARSKVKDRANLGEEDDVIDDLDETTASIHPAQSNGNDDNYYDMIAKRNEERKQERRRMASTLAGAAEASEQGRPAGLGELGSNSKRGVTYAIEKNKGLTPRRKKEVRNPRVKKRMRYEDKKKKLGSMKPLYKGGEGKGGYRGELTGIKTDVVKSIKL